MALKFICPGCRGSGIIAIIPDATVSLEVIFDVMDSDYDAGEDDFGPAEDPALWLGYRSASYRSMEDGHYECVTCKFVIPDIEDDLNLLREWLMNQDYNIQEHPNNIQHNMLSHLVLYVNKKRVAALIVPVNDVEDGVNQLYEGPLKKVWPNAECAKDREDLVRRIPKNLVFDCFGFPVSYGHDGHDNSNVFIIYNIIISANDANTTIFKKGMIIYEHPETKQGS